MARKSLTTLKASSDRIRHTTDVDKAPAKSSSRPKAQVDRNNSQRKEDHEAMERAVDEWLSYTMSKAAELSERFDKKPRYFLDRFFLGGQKLIYKQNVPNAFNAFKSIKAAELRADGERGDAITVQQLYKDEYEALTAEQRAEYIAEFEAMKSTSAHIPRLTSRGCIQDVANVVRNMEVMLDGLKTRVGIEAFFCIVRNNTEFHVNPTWYFTSQELANYMPVAVGKKWTNESVASKLEAFAIAGCDAINLNRTSQQKASHMKREISNLIGTNLVAITGNPKATMQYTNYEEAIVLKYGIELVGWTHERFCNPSELSNSLEPLRRLHDAISNSTCKFVKLSPMERRAREAKYRADVASGAIVVKPRKTRKDAGSKRKGSGDEERPSKRIRSEAVINDDDDDNGGTPVVQGAADSVSDATTKAAACEAAT